MLVVFPAFLVIQLVIASFIPLTVKAADSSEACGDALKRSTNLCKRWKRGGMCAESNVRAFCQETCNLCQDEDIAGENDDYVPRKYLGCFRDGVESELKLMSFRFPVTVQSCVGACRLKNYKYAGLRNGKFCMCGNDYGSHGEVLKRDGCSKTCGGREACGGPMENSLYQADYNKEKNERQYFEDIEKLVLGKKRKEMLSKRRPHHKPHVKLTIPKERNWDFESWIRKYEEQKAEDKF